MKDDFDTYSLFGGDAAGGATPREPAKRSSPEPRGARTRSRYRSDVLSGDAYGFRAPEPVRETRAAVISVSDICRGIQKFAGRRPFLPRLGWNHASFMVTESGLLLSEGPRA